MIHLIKELCTAFFTFLRDASGAVLRVLQGAVPVRVPAEDRQPAIRPRRRLRDQRLAPRTRRAGKDAPASRPSDPYDLKVDASPARSYAAQPLGQVPLCIPLPAGWFEDLSYVPRPYACANATALPPQFGNLGTTLRAGENISCNYNDLFAHGFFGPPNSGKSYAVGVHIENALVPCRYLNVLLKPMCCIALSYSRHSGGNRKTELLKSRYPNQDPEEVRRLIHSFGSLPQGIDDVFALTLEKQVDQVHRENPHSGVGALKFPCRELGITGLRMLMVLDEQEDSLISEEIDDMLATLPPGFKKEDLMRAIQTYDFRSEYLRDTVRRRARLACQYIDDSVSIRDLIKAGRLIIVDIKDTWLTVKKAMTLFSIVLNTFFMGEGELPCGLLLCIDEAHHFLEHKALRLQIERIIKERRHLRTSVVLSSQDPTKVPHSTLAELDGVGLFATSSEKSIKHLTQDIEPFSLLKAEEAARLKRGQMFFWSKTWYSPYQPGEFDQGLVRVEVRARLAHHGGASRTAVEG